MRTLICMVVLLLTGCSNDLDAKYIRCYSGDRLVYDGHFKGKLETTSQGWYKFFDEDAEKMVSVGNTSCIVTGRYFDL